jgi:hypothetical protein
MNFPLSIVSMAIKNILTYSTTLLSTSADIFQSHGRYTKVKFTSAEDARLLDLVPRQCRERYQNYLNPELRNDSWTLEEDTLLENKCDELGPKWSRIAKFFENRSDNALRNRWMMLNRHHSKSINECGNANRHQPTDCPI